MNPTPKPSATVNFSSLTIRDVFYCDVEVDVSEILVEDCGIGGYEFHGSHGTDVRYEVTDFKVDEIRVEDMAVLPITIDYDEDTDLLEHITEKLNEFDWVKEDEDARD